MPRPRTRRKPITDLPASPTLSVVKNGPESFFKGRKLGVLAADGADSKLLAALEKAAKDEGRPVEFIAPKVSLDISPPGC
ncbi:MAG TPA: hypothetical protein VGG57_22710 [Stellaceae bacterium]|jgi:catalase